LNLPSILVVSLGGTITMTAATGAAGGIVPTLTAADLLASSPKLATVARLEAWTLFGLPGAMRGPQGAGAALGGLVGAQWGEPACLWLARGWRENPVPG
jgi:hypothetical protein